MKLFDVVCDDDMGRLYVNRMTGEVFTPQDDDGYYILSANQMQSRHEKAARWRKAQLDRSPPPFGNFIWIQVPMTKALFPGISNSHGGHLLRLATYMDYTGVLPERIPVTPTGISQAFSISRREASRFLTDIKERQYIQMTGQNAAQMSPDIFSRGALQSPAPGHFYTRLYTDGVQALSRSSDALKYVALMLPYLHKTINVLCENPTEPELGQIRPLSWSAFCKLVGYKPRQTSRLSQQLFHTQFNIGETTQQLLVRIKGPPMISGVYLNPRIAYAGTLKTAQMLQPHFLVQPQNKGEDRNAK